jgi:thermitase
MKTRLFWLILLLLVGGILFGSVGPNSAAADQPTPQAEIVPGEFVVKFKPDATSQDRARVFAALSARVVDEDRDLGIARVRVPAGVGKDSVLKRFAADAAVVWVEPNYRVHAVGKGVTPNDPDFAALQWGLQKIRAPEAWARTKGNANVLAVIDSGVQLDHPDLQAKIVAGYNFITPGTPPDDDYGHGTHVAGIAAARTNNGIGIAGVSWNARIMPLKMLDAGGGGTTYDLARAIKYAAQHNARVANMSLGGYSGDDRCWQAVQVAADYAHARGVVLVAAAGNYGTNEPFFPAACSHVIAVAATDENDQHPYFSNYGNWIDIAAPGTNIWSTYPPNSYTYLYGTSMATPFVAGVAMLVETVAPRLSPDGVELQLKHSVDQIGSRLYFGAGRVNAARAVCYPFTFACGAMSMPVLDGLGNLR